MHQVFLLLLFLKINFLFNYVSVIGGCELPGVGELGSPQEQKAILTLERAS